MVDFITETISEGSYLGIALLMLVENIFPPIPSELIMPFAGFVAARGEMSVIGVVIAGTLGSVLGTFLWYIAARWFGERRVRAFALKFERWLTLTQKEIDDAQWWFDRKGWLAVLLGRLLPGIRTIISVPAGVARMPVYTFLLLTTIGSLVWVSILTILGLVLDAQYVLVEEWLDPVSKMILFGLIGWYVYRVVTYGMRSKGQKQTDNDSDNYTQL
ncbi:MAG: DedA family protein [Candidatus Campbellbacteria bacterium]|nr:DedA family protein [Candidatus Campbellbacteria bacterium]